jgi:uroporphyrinogen decarboxylase
VNNIFLQALRCENISRPPIWLMRQAGRFLPEYRALRAEHSFRHLVTTPSLAAKVTRLPIDLLGFDAAILFSDILVVAEIFGYTIDFSEGKGIKLLPPIQDVELQYVGYVAEAIRLLKQDLTVPLIGFCGGPYTVATYMKTLTPAWLERITAATISYLQMQIQAGVDAIQIFDSWAGKLEPADFEIWALPYLKAVVEAIRPTGIPIILFCRGSCRLIPQLSNLRPAAIGFDWDQEMAQLRQLVPSHIAIQGNLNPALLKGPLPLLQKEVESILTSMQGARGFIFNLGHGVEPDTPVDNVRWLVECVKTYHLTTGGMEHKIASGLPPERNPNWVPRS